MFTKKNFAKFILSGLIATSVGGTIALALSTENMSSNDIQAEMTAIQADMQEYKDIQTYAHDLAENARLLGEKEDGCIILFAKNKWQNAETEYQKLLQEYNNLKNEYEEKKVEENSKGEYLGEFKLTHYCAGSCCNGGYNGTALGTPIVAGKTIAVDPKVIPLGSEVYIEGYGIFVAEDTGGAIKGNRIDVAVGSHSEAMSKGIGYAKVYIK